MSEEKALRAICPKCDGPVVVVQDGKVADALFYTTTGDLVISNAFDLRVGPDEILCKSRCGWRTELPEVVFLRDLRLAFVEIADLCGPYEAFIPPFARWNGWVCPAFTRQTADRLMEDLLATGDFLIARFEPGQNAYIVQARDDSGPSIYQADGLHLYPIGAFGWTWEESGRDETSTD